MKTLVLTLALLTFITSAFISAKDGDYTEMVAWICAAILAL